MKAKAYGESLLTIDSTITEILQEHVKGKRSMASIAKELGVSAKALTNVLKQIGYEYDATIKQWRFVWVTGSDYRNCTFYSIQQGTAQPIPLVEDTSYTMIDLEEPNTSGNTDITADTEDTSDVKEELSFTIAEIRFLKHLVATQDQNHIKGAEPILNAIERLPVPNKTNKKTFALDETVIQELDAFCEMMRIRKSDFLAIAITEALHKYKP